MLFEGHTHFIFPTNCFIVEGAERDLIYDLNRVDYDIITKDISHAIKESSSCSFDELFENLPKEDFDFYKEFVNELIKKDYLIPIDAEEVEFFEAMSTEWYYPYPFSNAIIEFSKDSPFELIEAIQKIDQLNCPAIEIRLTESQDLKFYKTLTESINGLGFSQVDLLICYQEEQEDDFMFEMKKLHPVYFYITQYDSPVEKQVKNSEGYYVGLKRTRSSYGEIVSDHQITPKKFFINRRFYLEALKYNTFFNGKIVILKDGTVKNGTNQQRSFGNISETDLRTLSNDPEFTRLWRVSKDKIKICQDCEYRYMCLDSRVPVMNSENEWEYEDTCNYDPYTCKWSNVD